MNRPYYIGYHDTSLNKKMFVGELEATFYSDFQSAKAYSLPEAHKAHKELKRKFRGDYKRLKIIKILPVELEL